jgi:hypothetical protein
MALARSLKVVAPAIGSPGVTPIIELPQPVGGNSSFPRNDPEMPALDYLDAAAAIEVPGGEVLCFQRKMDPAGAFNHDIIA